MLVLVDLWFQGLKDQARILILISLYRPEHMPE